MGGVGSGNYYRWNSSTIKTEEEVHRVDIHFLKKQGFLSPGTHGSLAWNCGSEPTDNIRFKTKQDAIHLICSHRQRGEDWQARNERIAFD